MKPHIALPALGGLLLASRGGRSVVVEERPPNIVVVLADDLGYSDLGAHGGEIATRSIASVSPTGPAPMTVTCVSTVLRLPCYVVATCSNSHGQSMKMKGGDWTPRACCMPSRLQAKSFQSSSLSERTPRASSSIASTWLPFARRRARA